MLDGETVPYIDVTAVRMLLELEDDLGATASRLLLARDVGQVRELVRRRHRRPGGTTRPCRPPSRRSATASRGDVSVGPDTGSISPTRQVLSKNDCSGL